MNIDINKLLVEMSSNRASDLHINANAPLLYRIDGELVKAAEKTLTPDEAKDATDLPEASGDAIAREFERYLRRRGDSGGR